MAQTDYDFGRYPMDGTDTSVKNTSNAAMNLIGQAGGLLVKLDTTTANLVGQGAAVVGAVLTTAVTDIPLGVTVEDIPSLYVGRIQIAGFGICTAPGAITIGSTVGPSGATNGYVTAYTATDPYFGQSLSTPASAGDPVLVHIMPGITA